MKKLVLLAVALISVTNAFAQTKGETQFMMAGWLYDNSKSNASGASSSWSTLPAVGVRYYMADKIGIDGGLMYFDGKGADAGFSLMGGAHYTYFAQDKLRVNGGVALVLNLGKGNQTFDDKGKKAQPMDILIDVAEAEYWPMEGGAMYGNLYYNLNGINLGDAGSKSFGIGLGIKIRIK